MAHVWQAASAERALEPGAGVSPYRGLRAFEQSWRRLERAATRGDALELAAASASAGRTCLDDDDLDEAQWHLRRGRHFLDAHAPCPRGFTLRCDMAALSLQLADRYEHDDEPVARRLREETRDGLFDIVREVTQGHDPALAATLHRVADLLDRLGDHSDAATVRRQAGGGPPSCAGSTGLHR